MTTIQGLIASKRARIEARIGSESDLTDALIDKIGKLTIAEGAVAGSSGTAVDPASIASGIGLASEINSIKASLIGILAELVNTKAFADLLVQDTANNYFIRREIIDQTTGNRIVEVERLDGAAGAPVGALAPIKQNTGDSVLENKYYAAAAGGGFSIGDSLSHVRVVNGETKAVTFLGWFNISTQTLLASVPSTGALKGYEDLVEELLAKIVAVLPASLGAKSMGASLPVVLPIDGVLPLPTGAATALAQTDQLTALNAIKTSGTRQITSTLYRATTDGTGYLAGHLIDYIQEWDSSTDNPTYVGGSYRNLTLGTTLVSPPPPSSIDLGNYALFFGRSGSFNLLDTGFDVRLVGRTRRIVATNLNSTGFYLQFHDSALPLAIGAVPLATEVYQLPAHTTLPFTAADLGEFGTVFGVNPRLALSTTFASYTPPTTLPANTISLFVENV